MWGGNNYLHMFSYKTPPKYAFGGHIWFEGKAIEITKERNGNESVTMKTN